MIAVAGFDPSGGAGVLADVKTFEAHKVLGFGVASCLTFQTENQFLGISPFGHEEIWKQLAPLLNQYQVSGVKLGLVKDLETAHFVIENIKKINPEITIVWDPVMKATAGEELWSAKDSENLLLACLEKVDIITPNLPEMKKLFGDSLQEGINKATQHCHLVLKGGHDEQAKGVDAFFSKGDSKSLRYKSKKLSAIEKHGSGCVFSSSLLSNIVQGFPMHQAMLKTKRYMDKFFNSSPTLLGFHKF